jgi:uncharacterized membrane protein
MEFLLVLLLLGIIYLLITHKSSYDAKLLKLETRIAELQHLLKSNITNTAVKSNLTESDTLPVPPPQPADLPKPAVPLTPPQYVDRTRVEQHKDPISEPSPVPKSIQRPSFKPPVYKTLEPRQSFFERHPDLEKFIGENLINKIGIAILVLAIGFFVKYAIDNNWVGPIGRVGIGVLCGAILVGIAHKLRTSYKAFSSVLVGGGLAIFYFTITLAYHQFHLFNQTAAFIILIVITLFACALALLYDRQELAVIALVGGLASPFMVSNGHANYNALFIYLLILNAGLLIIAYFKLWRILNASAFGLTVLIVAGVVFTVPDAAAGIVFWYCSVLYLMFFAINVANNVKENKAFISADFSILLINTSLYFAAGLYLLTVMHHEGLRGVFSASLAVINLVLSLVLFKAKKVDTNILYLLIGITLTFISLTAPIQLNGHYITMFWSVEAVLLYWLYLKSGIKLMKLTSLIVWGTMFISLLMDWTQLYSSSLLIYTVIANKGFITTLIAAVATYGLYLLIEKDTTQDIYGFGVKAKPYQYIAFALLFLSGLLEINHQFLSRYLGTPLNAVYLMLYITAFVYMFYRITMRVNAIAIPWLVNLCLIAVTLMVYLFAVPYFFDVQYDMLLNHKMSTFHFMAHWAGAVFAGLLFYELIKLAKQNLSERAITIASWIIAASIVTFLSLEVALAGNQLFYNAAKSLDRIRTVYIKTGLPVLWGLASFAMMWLGMKYKLSTLRIISLTLFAITLIKLFVFDIRNIPPAGKIAAFFCLGVLLLIVSFMYQKVKKIIVQDETES